MKHYIRCGIIIIFVLVIDLITKHFLSNINYQNLIPHVLSIATNGGNTGAAWGMFGGQTVLLIVVSIIMIAGIVVFDALYKDKSVWFDIGLSLILAGAIGNLIDRIALGYVRDFIFLDFMPSFPIFNFADSALCVGAVVLVISILFKRGGNEQ